MGVQVSVEITPCHSLAIVKETDVMAKFLLHTLLLRSDKMECLQIDVLFLLQSVMQHKAVPWWI